MEYRQGRRGDIRAYTHEDSPEVLNRDVVFCDTSTQTGDLHIRIPSVSNTTDITIFIQVDGTSTEPDFTDGLFGRNGTWFGYRYAFHFHDNPTGGSVLNSQGPSGDGTVSGSMNSDDLISGGFGDGDAYDFDGSDDHVNVSPVLGNASNAIVTGWIRPDIDTRDTNIYTRGKQAGAQTFVTWWDEGEKDATGGPLAYIISTSDGQVPGGTRYSATKIPIGTWTHFAITYQRDDAVRLYFNGVLDANSPVSVGDFAILSGDYEENIANDDGSSSGNKHFDGGIDELRVGWSTDTMSGARIAADYANQSSPSTFYSISVTEPGVGGATLKVLDGESWLSATRKRLDGESWVEVPTTVTDEYIRNTLWHNDSYNPTNQAFTPLPPTLW